MLGPRVTRLLASHHCQPNYMAMVSTDYFGVQGDGNVVMDHTLIVDTLEAKGISWGGVLAICRVG